MKNNFFRTIIAILTVLSLTGCGNEERKSFYDNGQVKTIGFYDSDGKRQDAFKMYAEDGSLLEETTYKDNKIVSGYVIKNNIETIDGIKHSLIKKTEYNNGVIKNIKINNDKNEIITDLNYDSNGNKLSGFETVKEDYSIKFKPDFPYASFGYQITSSENIIKNEYTNGKITNTNIIQEVNKELISDAMAAIIGDQLSKGNNNFCKIFENSIELQEIYLNTIVSHSHHIKGDVAQKLYDEYACMRKELTSSKTEEKFVQAISDTKKLLKWNYTSYFKVSKYFDLLTFEQKKSLLKDNKDILEELNSFNGLSKELLIFITIEFEKREAFEAIPIAQLTEEDKKYFIENKPKIYPLIPSPSIEIQKLAVEKEPENIQYIKNPSIELQKLAVEKEPNNIQYIKNQSDDISWLAIKKSLGTIEYIKDPTKEMFLYILEKNVRYLSSLKLPEDIQFSILEKNPEFLRFIYKPTKNIINHLKELYFEKLQEIDLINFINSDPELINNFSFEELLLLTLNPDDGRSIFRSLDRLDKNNPFKDWISNVPLYGNRIDFRKANVDEILSKISKKYEDFILKYNPYLYTYIDDVPLDIQTKLLKGKYKSYRTLFDIKSLNPKLKFDLISKARIDIFNDDFEVYNFEKYPELTKISLIINGYHGHNKQENMIISEELQSFIENLKFKILPQKTVDKYYPQDEKEIEIKVITTQKYEELTANKFSESDRKIIEKILANSFYYGSLFKDLKIDNSEIIDYLVNKSPALIRYVDNPSEVAQFLAVKYFHYIKKPTNRVINHALLVKPYNLKYLKDITLSYEQYLLAIERDPRLIRFIKNPSDKLKNRALKIYPLVEFLLPPFKSDETFKNISSKSKEDFKKNYNFDNLNENDKKIITKFLDGKYLKDDDFKKLNTKDNEALKVILTEDPKFIKYIDNPSEDLQLLVTYLQTIYDLNDI